MSAAADVACPVAVPGQVVLDGPARVRQELCWRVRLPDGRDAVVAQLVPELAAEPALRRRYVHDVERLAAAGAPSIAAVLAIGPAPDPRDLAAAPPWRARLAPSGRTLEDWLGADGARRPVDEAVAVGAAVADALAAALAAGVVLRDLEPRAAVLADDGAITFTDVGLARLGILSSRTASTLALDASPWAAPEHLRATVVDPRADVYTLGAILHRALVGVAPGAEPGADASPLRRAAAVPSLRALVPAVPEALDALVRRCLDPSPDARPATAREVAEALRGGGGGALAIARVTCQACGAPLRAGLRLCLSCGKQAVQVAHVPDGQHALLLTKIGETPEHTAALRALFETFAAEVPSLNFLIGDERYYAKEERETLHRLPARLFDDLDEAGARALAARLTAKGLTTRVVDLAKVQRRRRRTGWIIPGGLAAAVGGVIGLAAGAVAVAPGVALIAGGGLAALGAAIYRGAIAGLKRPALARLRAAPAALPAADPLVARVAGLLPEVRAADLRERVAELALWLQRIADHRAAVAGDAAAAAEIDAVLAPVARLADALAAQVRALVDLDAELATLDEGALVRALAAAEARGEPPARQAELLGGLDRLRGLEDRRAAAMARLLDAGSLLRRAAELVLAEGAEAQADAAEVARATALLDTARESG